MSRLVAQRYATDEAVQADVVRAEVEVAHAAGELRMADLSIDGAQAALSAAMSQSPDDPLGMPEDPPAPDLPSSAIGFVERALRDRPELAAHDADLAREQAALRLAEKGYLPDFELSVGAWIAEKPSPLTADRRGARDSRQ